MAANDMLRFMPGWAGYQMRREQQRGEDESELRQESALMQLAEQVRARQAAAQAEQRNEALRAAIAQLPPEKRTRENVLPLLLQHASNPRDIAAALPAAESKGQPIGSGGLLMPGGTVVPPAARPDATARAPQTRQRYDGTNVVQEEFVDGAWREIGRGPRFQPEKPKPAPKPPNGYRWTDDTHSALEPIPGGKADTSARDTARAQGALQKANIVIGKVDEALKKTGFFSTGFLGAALGNVPGTEAYDLDKTIDTIKANLGFAELQAMREASPTGGALGQVAIQELAMLQSTVASLEKGQKTDVLRQNLEQVRRHYENWRKAVLEANPGLAGVPSAPGGTPAPSAPSAAPSGSWTVREKK